MKRLVLLLAVAPLLVSCVADDGPNATSRTSASASATSTANYGNFCRFYGMRQCRIPNAKPKGSSCFCPGPYGPIEGGIVD